VRRRFPGAFVASLLASATFVHVAAGDDWPVYLGEADATSIARLAAKEAHGAFEPITLVPQTDADADVGAAMPRWMRHTSTQVSSDVATTT